VIAGKVSPAAAREAYGVGVVRVERSLAVDQAETAALRRVSHAK
jgi:hypothetical protein